MQAIRIQYFLCFAVMGSILPYLSVLLQDGKGLGKVQIGDITSLTGWAVLLGPVVMTFLADVRLESKHLLMLAFFGSGAGLLGLWWAEGFWLIFLAFGVHSLLAMPILQLQDGLNFSVQQQRRERGRRAVPYHRVRVFGTYGFIVPALLLYLWLRQDVSANVTLLVAAGFCAIGIGNALWLPAVHVDRFNGTAGPPADIPDIQAANHTTSVNGQSPTRRNAPRLPTLDAAKALLEPHMLIFALAMWLCHLAAAAYYSFYPVYLTETIGIGKEWVGLIADLGVAVEVFFMLGFGFLVRRLGLRTLMAVGAGSMALRLVLLFAWPNVWVAVGTQLLHGLTVLTIHVGPPVYINERAGVGYRSSMQGLYAMLVYGTGRIIGSIVAGHLAAWSLLAMFGVAAALCLIASGMFALAFNDRTVRLHEAV